MPSPNHDGTQDPVPPPLMPDPLSGSVTGAKNDAEAARVRVIEPSMPDLIAVREAMASVLDDDSELMAGFARPVDDPGRVPAQSPPPGAEPNTAAAGPTPTPPAGIPVSALPPVAQTPQRVTPLARRLAGRAAGLLPRPIPGQRRVRVPRPRRRPAFSPGVGAIVALLLVIAVLAIVMLVSLINTISSLFT